MTAKERKAKSMHLTNLRKDPAFETKRLKALRIAQKEKKARRLNGQATENATSIPLDAIDAAERPEKRKYQKRDKTPPPTTMEQITLRLILSLVKQALGEK